nr:hypothetical protein [Tanacetum cinerariifolium]
IKKLSIGGLIVGKPNNRGKPSPSTTQVTRFVGGLDKTKVLKLRCKLRLSGRMLYFKENVMHRFRFIIKQTWK